VDFPSFIWDDEEKRWAANHHPFTSPHDEYLEMLRELKDEELVNPKSRLSQVKAKAYDLVINGYEAGGGSIRIHNPEIQSQVFRVLGMSSEQARQRFGFLRDAAHRYKQHPRRDRLSQEPESPRSHDRRPGRSGEETVEGAGIVSNCETIGCRL
jgi:aspartyl-tRNA synthetase